MEYIDLAGGGRMPVLGLGTWQLTGSTCTRVVRTALELGYRHIDTAEMYGNERAIGAAIATGIDRRELFITTKIHPDHLRADDVRRSTETSLRHLGTDYVDLLLIHWPNERIALEETLGAMRELREEGKTRAIGVSNFSASLLGKTIALSAAPIACDQVRYHAGYGQGPLLTVARRHGIAIAAYSPLAQGRLSRHAVLDEIAEKHGKAPMQIALRWLIEQDGVAAIPKASSERNLTANIDIFDFALSDDERKRLDAAGGPGPIARLAAWFRRGPAVAREKA